MKSVKIVYPVCSNCKSVILHLECRKGIETFRGKTTVKFPVNSFYPSICPNCGGKIEEIIDYGDRIDAIVRKPEDKKEATPENFRYAVAHVYVDGSNISIKPTVLCKTEDDAREACREEREYKKSVGEYELARITHAIKILD